jgi:hypothetical protein
MEARRCPQARDTIRHLAQAAGLLLRRKGYLRTTKTGRDLLTAAHSGALQVALFHAAFCKLDLSYLGGGLHLGWPQRDAGLVL